MQYHAWVRQKNNLAQSIGKGDLGGSYAEGAIILCAIISAMSSFLWTPSKGHDGDRFVEIITRFPPHNLDPTRVSAPLLAAAFPQLQQDLGISKMAFYLTEDCDKSEAEALRICEAARLRECKRTIRQYSYVNLLYEQVRCGFSHEYRGGKKSTDGDTLRKRAGVGSR